MQKFPDVETEKDTTRCKICKQLFIQSDYIFEISIVAGVESNGILHISSSIEYGHGRCFNQTKPKEEPRIVKPPTREDVEKLRPTTPTHICKICKSPLRRGDRILPVYIVLGGGIDPDTGAPGVMCSSEFEAIHVKCEDTKLNLGSYALVVGNG